MCNAGSQVERQDSKSLCLNFVRSTCHFVVTAFTPGHVYVNRGDITRRAKDLFMAYGAYGIVAILWHPPEGCDKVRNVEHLRIMSEPSTQNPSEDLESRAPILVPYTTIGQLQGTLKGDLLSRSARGSG